MLRNPKTRSLLSTSLALGVLTTASVLPSPAFARVVPTAKPAPAPVIKSQDNYIKELRGAGGRPEAAQTAIRRFKPLHGDGPSIYLVAAIHIGEKSYYKQVQQFLDKQDVVLFEGVRPSRTSARIKPPLVAEPHDPSGSAAEAPIGIQKKFSNALNLQFQLEGIHYNRPQFRNSDLDWDTMNALAKKAGPDTQKSLTELGNSVAGGPGISWSDRVLEEVLTLAASTPLVARGLRRLLVTALCDPDRMEALAGLKKEKNSKPGSGNQLDSILINARNKAVLSDIKALLQTSKKSSPKPIRSIAVFYGAGHMKDIEQHLVSDLGYRSAETQWITALHAAG